MQGEKTTDKHIQDFEKAALEAGYKGFPLIMEFEQSLHPILRKCLSEIRPQTITIEKWYKKSIMIVWQWRITKAEEAFYGKANQSGTARKPQQSQAGMPGIWNDTWPSYNSYRQGGYQNRSQTSSGLVMVLHQDTCLGQKDPNTMDVNRTQEHRPPIKCYKCQKMGHMMKYCRALLNIRKMTYEELCNHFEQAEAVKKDRDAIKVKEQKEKDFPDVENVMGLGTCADRGHGYVQVRVRIGIQ